MTLSIKLIIVFFSILFLYSCWDIKIENKIEGIAPGNWRGTFYLHNKKIPVDFKIINQVDGKDRIIFETDTIIVKPDTFFHYGDTLLIHFDNQNTLFKLVTEIDKMEGYLYYMDNYNYPVKFYALNSSLDRFPDVRKKPSYNISGNWDFAANISQDSVYKGEIEFYINKNYATAKLNFSANSGYLMEGTIQDSLIYLSGFNGKDILYLSATVNSDNRISRGELIKNDDIYFFQCNR